MSLDNIPEELVQNIASNLEDGDLVNLRAACRSTAAAIDARPAHFWMYRYQEHYDMPRGVSDLETLRKKYQKRRRVLRNLPVFKHGNTESEAKALAHLLDLIMDATPTTDNAYGIPHSKNFALLDNIIKRSNVLECIFERVKPGASAVPNVPMHQRHTVEGRKIASLWKIQAPSTLQMFQLILSARSLSFMPYPTILSFEYSQRAAYMDFETMPLFTGYGGLEVNMVWALHIVNFFRYHLLRESEATLFPAYKDLNDENDGVELPQLWKEKLSNEDKSVSLGSHWKGSYAYLGRKEVMELRRNKNTGSQIYVDHNVDLGHKAIQQLEMKFPGPEVDTVWPSNFERHLKGQSFLSEAAQKLQKEPLSPRSTRAKPLVFGPERPEDLKSHYYEVTGWDDETFWATGWINQLPTQKHVPGFKRMVMMKYFTTASGDIDHDALWAYEGIVLPGDQIIVGRWWSPQMPIVLSKIYSGPFILWNTDCGNKFKQIHDALDDSQSVQDAVKLTHD